MLPRQYLAAVGKYTDLSSYEAKMHILWQIDAVFL